MSSPVIHNVLGVSLPTIDHAEGVWLTDTVGNRYLDGSSGAVVVNIGHAHPEVVEAIARQAARISFTHRGAFTSHAIEELSEKLCRMTGFAGAWFVNSGSEANEAAIQFALQYFRERGESHRTWFLSHEFGYHGNTLGSLSLSGHSRRTALADLGHPFPVLPTPYAFRDADGMSESEYSERLLAGARVRFEQHAERLAGVVVEPVGGATLGATVPPDGYLQGLRALCDEFGALLIVDEVMTGIGRTGRMLGVDHWGVRPDIVTLGKGLGAGYTPIAAALLGAHILRAMAEGSGRILGGHTYGGNPLSVATTLAVLDIVERDGIVERSATTGEHLAAGLNGLRSRHPLVADTRGLGMLHAVELDVSRTASTAHGRPVDAVVRSALEHGLVLYAATGGYNQAVLVAPPLTTTVDEVDLLVDALDRALADAEALLSTNREEP